MHLRWATLALMLVAAAPLACTPAARGSDTSRTREPDLAPSRFTARQMPARITGTATARDGTPLYFERIGSGPAIVFIHGLGGNHAVWFQQVAHFAATHTVVTLSQRGFAPSAGNQDRYDVDVLVDDLARIMDAARIERAAVVGQSMGGWTALGMALSRPERVHALVLADTVAGIADDTIADHHRKMIEQARGVTASPPPLSMHPALDPSFSRAQPDMGYLYQALSTFGSPRPGVIAGQLAAARADAARLKANRVPTLFLFGRNDTVFPPDILRHAASLTGAARVREIEGGHSPYFERPHQWNAAVEEFLAEVDSAAR
ncbi:MAG TPA: alpha/beta hydrolase [Candidatus Binatia bacterium]|nr:alpha/beta hydrolase [Candidatus Binatia bacterium]